MTFTTRFFTTAALTLSIICGLAFGAAAKTRVRKANFLRQQQLGSTLEWFRENPIHYTLYRYSNLPSELTVFESKMRLFEGTISIEGSSAAAPVTCLYNGEPVADLTAIQIERYVDHKLVCHITHPETKRDPGDGPEAPEREAISVTYRAGNLSDPQDHDNLVKHLIVIVNKYLVSNGSLAPDFPVALQAGQTEHPQDLVTTTTLLPHPKSKCSSPAVTTDHILLFVCDLDGTEDGEVFFYSLAHKKLIKKQVITSVSPSDLHPLLAKRSDGSEYFAFTTSDDRLVAYSPQGELIYEVELGGYGARPIQVGDKLLTFTMSNSVPNYPAKNRVFLIDETGQITQEWARDGEDLSEALLVGEQIWIGAPNGMIEVFSQTGEHLRDIDTNAAATLAGGDIAFLTQDLNGQVLAASQKGQLFRVNPETAAVSLIYFAPNQGYNNVGYSSNKRDRSFISKPVVFQDGRIALATDVRVHFLTPDGKLERISFVGGFARIQGPLTIVKLGESEALWVGAAGSVQLFTPDGVQRYLHEIHDSENTSRPILISGDATTPQFAVGVYGGVRVYSHHLKTAAVSLTTDFWTGP